MNRRELSEALNWHEIRPKRSLGQNFLVDQRFVSRIVAGARLTKADQVIEIGPGGGAMTGELAKAAGRLKALEIDQRLRPVLEPLALAAGNIELIWSDARQISLCEITADWPGDTVVCANLPYYLTTELICQLICQLPLCRLFLLMVQKEAADRLLAASGSRSYGPLNVLLGLHQTERFLKVPAAAFWPQPDVSSTVLMITADDNSPDWLASTPVRQQYLLFLRTAFASRRKLLVSNLDVFGKKEVADCFTALALPPNIRAEQVNPDVFIKLFGRLCGPFV